MSEQVDRAAEVARFLCEEFTHTGRAMTDAEAMCLAIVSRWTDLSLDELVRAQEIAFEFKQAEAAERKAYT